MESTASSGEGLSQLMQEEFEKNGCLLLEGVLNDADLAPVKKLLLSQIREYVPDATGIQDPTWVSAAIERPEVVGKIYDSVRDHPALLNIATLPAVSSIVTHLLEEPRLYKKTPLRIDVPLETKEMAFWHQDHFYVQGNSSELTIWIPLQDTLAHHGALSVMKGSHLNGAIDHSHPVGKKTIPVGIFDVPVNIIEMREGDILVFDSFLVHSSNLNISDRIRYSIQPRYTSAQAGVESSIMGGSIVV